MAKSNKLVTALKKLKAKEVKRKPNPELRRQMGVLLEEAGETRTATAVATAAGISSANASGFRKFAYTCIDSDTVQLVQDMFEQENQRLPWTLLVTAAGCWDRDQFLNLMELACKERMNATKLQKYMYLCGYARKRHESKELAVVGAANRSMAALDSLSGTLTSRVDKGLRKQIAQKLQSNFQTVSTVVDRKLEKALKR